MADLIIQPKNDDHLKLNNDAGTTILELANDESKLRLAQNNISASDGTTAITTSGANVTLAGTANNIGTVTSGTFNGTIGSSATFPSNSVFFLGKNEVTSTGALDNSSSGFQDTGLEISISDVSAYREIIIQAVTGTRIESGSYNLARYRLQRTAPLAAYTLNFYDQTGLVASTPPYQAVISLQGIDDSLGSGTHTYKVQYSRYFGSDVTYVGSSTSIATILAFGVV